MKKSQTLEDKVPVKEVPKEAEKKHKDFWADVITDFDGTVDPFLLSKKDPDYQYRYLRSDDKNLAMKTSNILFDRGGWRLCPKEHLLKIGIKEAQISVDGFYRVGSDTVLAYMPKDLYAKKLAHKNKVANEPMNQINRLLKEGDKTVGGTEIHDSMSGLQTQKQLKMKD